MSCNRTGNKCADAAKLLGIYEFWAGEYRRKCHKKGRECPLDQLELETGAKG